MALPRFFYVAKGLPYYSIDENDVVEYALGYYGGSLHPSWFKYGAFYSYLLSTIYYIQSLFSSGTIHDFVERYFADPFSFFYSARALNSLIHVGIASLVFQVARTINLKVALWATVLALIPYNDVLTSFTVRVDSLLAINATASILFGVYYARKGHVLSFAFAGLFAGFALGSKTLPALMLFPSLLLATILWSHRFDRRHVKTKDHLWMSVLRTPLNWHNYLFLCTVILGLLLSHPYSILDFESFLGEQLYAIEADGSSEATKGYVISRFSGTLGYPFLIAGPLSTFYAVYVGWNERRASLLISTSYVAVFWLAFAAAPARNYFYVPIIGFLCFAIAFSVFDLLRKSSLQQKWQSALVAIVFVVLSFQPFKAVFPQFIQYGVSFNKVITTAQSTAKAWMMQNIDYGTPVMYYGYSVSLPKVIDPNPNEQAVYGEYFMYQRDRNEYWKERFSSFMTNLANYDLPYYDIIYSVNFRVDDQQKQYYLRYEMGEDEQYLFPLMQQAGIEYIVTEYDLQKYTEFQQALVWSSRGKGLQGKDVYIYCVLTD